MCLIAAKCCIADDAGQVEPRVAADSCQLTAGAASQPESRYDCATAALDADQPEVAREILERIVADRPAFAGAWVDLALAAYRSGDRQAGLEHLEYLQSHFSLPPMLARQIAEWLETWRKVDVVVASDAQRVAKDTWHGEVLMGFGRDNNVNAGLSGSSLSLTFPTGSVELALDRTSRPYRDNFLLLDVNVGGPAYGIAGGSFTPILAVHGKRLFEQRSFDTLDAQAGGVYLRPAEQGGRWRLSGLVQQYWLGETAMAEIARGDIQRLQSFGPCEGAAGLEFEARHALAADEIGGSSKNALGSLMCALPGEAMVGLGVRYGTTDPKAGWPGGEKHGYELALQYGQTLWTGARLELLWRTNRLVDREGYSPLLDYGAPKRVGRQTLSASLRQPLLSDVDLLLSVELLRQRSNLALFGYDAALATAALAWRF